MDWQFVNSFAPWLSAFGTIFAAIMALRLARRDDKRTVIIDTDCGPKYPREGVPESICIRVSNVSRRPIPITGVFWEGRSFSWHDKPIMSSQLPAHNELSTALPAKLLEGDFLEIHLCPQDFANELFEHAGRIKVIESFLGIRMLRVKVECGNGHYFTSQLSKQLKQHIFKQYFPHNYNQFKWLSHWV